MQPKIVLQTLFGGNQQERQASVEMMRWVSGHHGNPLDALSQQEIVAWCEKEPESRYLTMAAVVSYLRGSEEEVASQWSDIALTLLGRAPDPVAVARTFVGRFHPSSWSGSLAAILEGRKGLLTERERHPDPRLVSFAQAESGRLATEIQSVVKWEAERSRSMDQRFE